jgi:VanZ family protein
VPLTVPVIIAVLITYGSLFPFDFVAPASFRTALAALLADRVFWTSLSDVVGNVALFVPFGVTTVWWTTKHMSRPNAILFTALAGLTLAFVVQVVQIFVPERSAAMADVVWNGVGMLLGAVIGLIAEKSVLARGRHVETPNLVALGLLAIWIVTELAPLVPALDFVGLKNSLKPLLLNPRLDPAAAGYTAAQVLLVARLIVALVGARRGTPVLALGLGTVLVGKLFIEDQTLDLSTVVGFTIGAAVWWAWISRLDRPMASRTVLFLLLLAYTVQELSPFTLRASPSSFSWIPFATSLEGSMLTNSRALTASAFSLAGCVWLIGDIGWRVWAASVPLACCVFLLEWTQRWITGRTASITDPLVVLSAAWFMGRAAPQRAMDVRTVEAAAPVVRPPSPPVRTTGLLAPAITATVTVVGIVMAIRLILRLPGVPYNVSELFLDRGSALVIFAVALLWMGGGPMLLAHWLAGSRRPYFVLPAGAVIAAMISRTLLKYSVTYESLDDILGSSDLFSQVTRENMWGDFWRRAFLATNAPDLVEYFERRGRYMALYSPLLICLAFALVPIARTYRRRTATRWPQLLGLGLVTIAWLWISKIIIFDWADTDNLTELVAAHGPLNLGGGLFLYLLVALMAANVALLLRAAERATWLAAAVVFSIAAIPLGWFLLGAGLEQHVDKYGLVFSGTQFLLGPDRQHSLTEAMLFMRWAVVQTGGVAVMFVGAWIAHAVVRRFIAPQTG